MRTAAVARRGVWPAAPEQSGANVPEVREEVIRRPKPAADAAHGKTSAWEHGYGNKGGDRAAVGRLMGPYLLSYEACEPCCLYLQTSQPGFRFVSARLGPLLCNDKIAKDGSLKVIGDWDSEGDTPLEWVVANAPLRRMASESPIGLVGCRFKLWSHARVSRRWIGRMAPVSVPSLPRATKVGSLELVVALHRGVAAEEALSRGSRVIHAPQEAY